jgi:excisionase family DNA binding protein
MLMNVEIENTPDSLTFNRPFASPDSAAALLECSRFILSGHIENGRLSLLFDIARPGVKRLCLRIATPSLLALKTGLKLPTDDGKFLNGAFPQPFYNAPALAALLQCDYDHIYNLIQAKALADMGRGTHYLIPRESIIEFLTKRRVG